MSAQQVHKYVMTQSLSHGQHEHQYGSVWHGIVLSLLVCVRGNVDDRLPANRNELFEASVGCSKSN